MDREHALAVAHEALGVAGLAFQLIIVTFAEISPDDSARSLTPCPLDKQGISARK